MGYIWRMESEIRLKMGRAASVYFRVEGGLRGAEEAGVQVVVKEWGDREVEVAGEMSCRSNQKQSMEGQAGFHLEL